MPAEQIRHVFDACEALELHPHAPSNLVVRLAREKLSDLAGKSSPQVELERSQWREVITDYSNPKSRRTRDIALDNADIIEGRNLEDPPISARVLNEILNRPLRPRTDHLTGFNPLLTMVVPGYAVAVATRYFLAETQNFFAIMQSAVIEAGTTLNRPKTAFDPQVSTKNEVQPATRMVTLAGRQTSLTTADNHSLAPELAVFREYPLRGGVIANRAQSLNGVRMSQ